MLDIMDGFFLATGGRLAVAVDIITIGTKYIFSAIRGSVLA